MLMTLPLPAELEMRWSSRLQSQVPLAPYTAARLGGQADYLLIVRSADELAQAVESLWAAEVPYLILGGGSNLLVSDRGVRGLVILNRARKVQFLSQAEPPRVWAESGANFGSLARQAGLKGLAGLAWAAGIPGTLGGAVVGNAGAHGGDMTGNLMMAEILHLTEGRVRWPLERLAYAYRTSFLKSHPGQAVVLSATLRLEASNEREVRQEMERYLQYRRQTQPPGASMGSMFKNPPGDYAGRLIEAVGLKGARVGDAQISPLHANFFLNQGAAVAGDVLQLIRLARRRVAEQFGINLELEIELVGDWSGYELQ